MKIHFDGAGAPGIDFDYHCQWPTNSPTSSWPSPNSGGFSMLSCLNIGQDIATCQSLGKRVILVISPYDSLADDAAGVKSAENVWNYFLGGTTQYRPFGNAAVLDGVDLHIWNNNAVGYVSFLTTLKQLMNSDTSRSYLIAASPKCVYPDYALNYPISTTDSTPRVLTTNPELFDYIIPLGINNPAQCGWGINKAGFWEAFNIWSRQLYAQNPDIKMIVGITSYYNPAYAQATEGDYIPVAELISSKFVSTLAKNNSVNFGGVALWDTSYDAIYFPCNATTSSTLLSTASYSTIVSKLLKGESVSGCKPIAVSASNDATTITDTALPSNVGGADTGRAVSLAQQATHGNPQGAPTPPCTTCRLNQQSDADPISRGLHAVMVILVALFFAL